MKASSLLRHIWVGCFICALFVFTTGVAYAHGVSSPKPEKEHASIKTELVLQPVEPVKKTAETGHATAPQQIRAAENEPKQPEVKKEGASSGFVSFNFLYYLFYKTKFAEATNNALRNSWNAFVDCLFN